MGTDNCPDFTSRRHTPTQSSASALTPCATDSTHTLHLQAIFLKLESRPPMLFHFTFIGQKNTNAQSITIFILTFSLQIEASVDTMKGPGQEAATCQIVR